jgi:hypothetical protein
MWNSISRAAKYTTVRLTTRHSPWARASRIRVPAMPGTTATGSPDSRPWMALRMVQGIQAPKPEVASRAIRPTAQYTG